MNQTKEQLQKSKDEFFASVNHELRNPLNALIGCIDIISHSADSPPDKKILKTAKICGDTLLNLIGCLQCFLNYFRERA